MKRYLIFLICFLLISASCKKDKSPADPDGYFFRARINGVLTEFNKFVAAIRSQDASTPYLVVVTGKSVPAYMDIPSFTLVLNDDIPLGKKTYVKGADAIEVGYSVPQLMPYNAEAGFEITISQLNAADIKGSFKGRLRNAAGQTVEVSEGLFFAKIF